MTYMRKRMTFSSGGIEHLDWIFFQQLVRAIPLKTNLMGREELLDTGRSQLCHRFADQLTNSSPTERQKGHCATRCIAWPWAQLGFNLTRLCATLHHQTWGHNGPTLGGAVGGSERKTITASI